MNDNKPISMFSCTPSATVVVPVVLVVTTRQTHATESLPFPNKASLAFFSRLGDVHLEQAAMCLADLGCLQRRLPLQQMADLVDECFFVADQVALREECVCETAANPHANAGMHKYSAAPLVFEILYMCFDSISSLLYLHRRCRFGDVHSRQSFAILVLPMKTFEYPTINLQATWSFQRLPTLSVHISRTNLFGLVYFRVWILILSLIRTRTSG